MIRIITSLMSIMAVAVTTAVASDRGDDLTYHCMPGPSTENDALTLLPFPLGIDDARASCTSIPNGRILYITSDKEQLAVEGTYLGVYYFDLISELAYDICGNYL